MNRTIFILLLAILLTVSVCLNIYQATADRMPQVQTVEHVQHDTIIIPIKEICYKSTIRTDTLFLHDTILYRERKTYEDTIARITFSGIDCNIDALQYNLPTVYKTQKVPTRKRITFGVEVGIGAQYGLIHRQFDIGPYAGVGMSVNF